MRNTVNLLAAPVMLCLAWWMLVLLAFSDASMIGADGISIMVMGAIAMSAVGPVAIVIALIGNIALLRLTKPRRRILRLTLACLANAPVTAVSLSGSVATLAYFHTEIAGLLVAGAFALSGLLVGLSVQGVVNAPR